MTVSLCLRNADFVFKEYLFLFELTFSKGIGFKLKCLFDRVLTLIFHAFWKVLVVIDNYLMFTQYFSSKF